MSAHFSINIDSHGAREPWNRTLLFGFRRCPVRLISSAFGDYQRDIVSLFMRAESSNLICSCCQQLRYGLLTMLADGFQQTLFAKFLSVTIQSFGNTIRVEQDGVAWSQFAFVDHALPFLEQTHHSAG